MANNFFGHTVFYFISFFFITLFNNALCFITKKKYVELFFKYLVKEKVFRYLLCDMGIGDIKKEVTNGDIGGGGERVYHLAF